MFRQTLTLGGRLYAGEAAKHLMTFSDLGLSEAVLKAVAEAGYETPTPIQAQAIPYVLQGRDVLGTAQTGTGKTAGFTLPLIDALAGGRARARMPRALILEPTRELADQVAQNFDKYGKYSKLSMALLIGGVSFGDQEKKLDRGVDVLIATPGRLLDHFERGGVMLGGVQVLVIDEADRMMDMGFMPDVERIVKLLPPLRQTLFFSATMPPEMRRLADQFLSNPREVSVAPQSSTAENVEQALVMVSPRKKHDALVKLIEHESVTNAIIFCNRKRDVDMLHKALVKHGMNAGALHGDLAQSVRMETLEKFKTGAVNILVASDVAARGLDVKGLSHVFNFDVPIHAEDYVHRIGRTGRAGMKGHAYTLATENDEKYVSAITRLIGKPIPVVTADRGSVDAVAAPEAVEAEAPAAEARSEAPRTRSRRGKRPDLRAVEGGKDAAPREESAPAEEREARPRKERERPERTERPRTERGRGRERERDDDGPVLGLGDHVPAFLLRPAIRGRS
jgi:superfamily II DNA/RNA helicase